MKSNDRQRFSTTSLTKQFYYKRLMIYVDDTDEGLAAHVGWSSSENQIAGFKAATDFRNLDWQKVNSVLDVGCGYGGLSEYLRVYKGYQGKYTGIDVMTQFITKAKDLYGGDRRNEFIEGDFFEFDWDNKKFDIVISQGIISVNYDLPYHYGLKSIAHAERAIDQMAHLANVAMSVYFPNADNADDTDAITDLAYYRSSDIQRIIENFFKDRNINIEINPYPNPNDVRTVARIYWDNFDGKSAREQGNH